jgi:RNA polymerase sigma-70 factor (ECF subfamily)
MVISGPSCPAPDRAAVASAFAAGGAVWPDVPLSADAFADHVTRLKVAAADLGLHGADLYLACACSLGLPAALKAFERQLFPIVERHIKRQGLARSGGEDVSQQLRIWLIGERPPRIASYAGRGQLIGWLKIVSTRRALRMAVQNAADLLVSDRVSPMRLPSPMIDPEASAVRRRHQIGYQQALDDSLNALSPRARAVLRLHYLEGHNIDAIGRVYGVHRATVARWLTAIQGTVLTRIRDHLPLSKRPTTSEFRHLTEDVRADLYINMDRALRGEAQRGSMAE